MSRGGPDLGAVYIDPSDVPYTEPIVPLSPELAAAARRVVARRARDADDCRLLVDALGLWPDGAP